MTNFETLKNMTVEEFTDWLYTNYNTDETSWVTWFDKKYCQACPVETVYVPALKKHAECAWCELNKKCKFFDDLEVAPSMREILKMWLENEVNNAER